MKKLKFTQGFTLIEVMITMFVIMIIAGMVMGVSRMARQKALEGKAESMIAALEIAISMYHTDTGEYPPTSDDTPPPDNNTPIAVVYDRLTNTDYNDGVGPPGSAEDIPGWNGPYMEFKDSDIAGGQIVDSWKRAYQYEKSPAAGNTQSFNLWSYGANKTNNSSAPDADCGDDITNWK